MGKATATSNNFLNLVYRAVAWANIADNAAASPLTNVQVALHTADPGAGGNQSTSETTYTSYARTAVGRTTGGWGAASGGAVSPAANIDAPAGTGGSGTLTHFSTGVAASGATAILHSGTITPNITAGNGVTPRLTTATTITET